MLRGLKAFARAGARHNAHNQRFIRLVIISPGHLIDRLAGIAFIVVMG